MKWPHFIFAVVFGILLESPALAHESETLALGLVGGFLHPIQGLDHFIAMIAVGLWGAFLGRPLVYLLPVVFPTVMTVGAILAMARLPFPSVEIGIAVSVVALGLAIATAYKAPVWLAAIVVGLFGLFHGYAHGLELPSMVDPISFSLGFVSATGLLHIVGIFLGVIRWVKFGEIILRVSGGLITLAGIGFLVAAV